MARAPLVMNSRALLRYDPTIDAMLCATGAGTFAHDVMAGTSLAITPEHVADYTGGVAKGLLPKR